jgi:hypothetical protein
MKKNKLNESILTNLKESAASINELAKFIEDSTNDLVNTNYTNSKFNLDEDLAVFVGWSDGYDENPTENEIYDKESPSYRPNAGIKVRNEADWADYDYLNFPWYPDGEVWDTGVTIEKNTNYKEVAEWLLKEYPYIVQAHENGEIYYYSEEEEND